MSLLNPWTMGSLEAGCNQQLKAHHAMPPFIPPQMYCSYVLLWNGGKCSVNEGRKEGRKDERRNHCGMRRAKIPLVASDS